MARSEIIKKYRAEIEQKMVEEYVFLTEKAKGCKYSLYIWEDGKFDGILTSTSDNSWLEAKSGEKRELAYVTDVIGDSMDDGDDINELADLYREKVSGLVDSIIEDAEKDEQEADEYGRMNETDAEYKLRKKEWEEEIRQIEAEENIRNF